MYTITRIIVHTQYPMFDIISDLAALPADAELDRGGAQLHHRLPHAHRAAHSRQTPVISAQIFSIGFGGFLCM